MPDSRRFTPLTPELMTDIKIAIAREGGIEQFAQITGIPARSIQRVMCQGYVSEDWLDRFCCVGNTDLWVGAFEWYTTGELRASGAWNAGGNYTDADKKRGWPKGKRIPDETRAKISATQKRRYNEQRIHEPPDDGAATVPE